MRLLGCHIEGFGSFANFDISFDEGLNIVFQPNGWGKTTISAFIEAMLYGFERKRVHNVKENKRLRYAPWAGGRYGGSLNLQSGGHRYRIKRTFGKTQSGDRTQVIDIDARRKIDVSAPTIGDWLLGLDSSAFQRSVFIGHDGIDFDGPVAGLRNRLNSLVGEAEDAPRFDQAINALDVRRRHYQKTGNRGRIADIDRGIDELVQRHNTLEAFVKQSCELQAQEASLEKSLEQIDNQLAKGQEDLETFRKADQELAALTEVRKNLVNRKEESESALESFRANMPYKLADVDVKGLGEQEESIERLQKEVANADAQIDVLVEQIEQVKARYGGSIPTKDEMDARSSQITDLQRIRAELDSLLSIATSQPSFASLSPASAPVEQAQSLLKSWPSAESNLIESDRIKSNMKEADAAWSIARKRVLDAKARNDAAEANVPDDVDEYLLRLNSAVDELRECLRVKDQLNVKISVLKAKLVAAGEKTSRDVVTAADIAHIDQLVHEVRSASEAVTPLREQTDSFATQVRELNRRKEAEQAALFDARSRVANAELERATAVREEADARSAYDVPSSDSGKTSLVGVACVIMGLVFGVAGVLGFLPLLVVAAVLLVFGVRRIKTQSEKPSNVSASKSEVTKAEDRLEKCERAWQKEKDELRSIETRYNAVDAERLDAEEGLAVASEALDQALMVEHDIKDELAREVNRLLPGEKLDAEVVVAQIDVLREMLATALNASDELADMRERLREYEMASHENDARAKLACERAGITTNGDITNDIDRASAKAHSISSNKSHLEEAREDLDKALADVPNYSRATGKPSLEEVISSECYPERDGQVARVTKLDEELDIYKRTLAATLNDFGLESTSDPRMDVERLRKALDDYKAKRQDWSRNEKRITKNRARERELTEELDAWARGLALGGEREMSEELISSLREDVDLVERLSWELANTNAKKEVASERMRAMQKALRSKLDSYGVSQTMEMREAVESLSKNVSVLFDLEKEHSSACEALVAWDKENGQRLETLRNTRRNGSLTSGEQTVAGIRRSREDLLTQLAQCTERREACLRDAEEYPKVLQRIALLAQEKQEAVSNLATVQGAAEYLQRARKRIDGRYLSGLVSRFNEYSVAWLGTDMGLDVNGELEVTVSEDDKPHDIAYYSTGYREILGVCLRMAFVDTIFEYEEPFLVMDDPFANLDQRNLDKALSVLQSIGKKRQIIYFTCHQSRADMNSPHGETDFVLPQKRESLELPQAMARREAEEREKKQAALVASYHVVPVTQGRASIELADNRRVVTNNIFYLRFEVKNGSGGRDNAFEAYFIDGSGKALCEKMSIEVRNGHVVPERLMFRLVTSENSGDAYELIIHEQGREQTELVSRTAFRAEVAFVSEDFGF